MSLSFQVKVICNDNREGLIRSQIKATNAAKGEVLVFLDSHCEVSRPGALELESPVSPQAYLHSTADTNKFLVDIDFKMLPKEKHLSFWTVIAL